MGRHSQLLVEPGLAAGLEVADDDAELPDVFHELLQVLLQVVELLRHGRATLTAPGVVRHRRCLLPPRLPATSASSGGGAGGTGAGHGRGLRGVCAGRDRGPGRRVSDLETPLCVLRAAGAGGGRLRDPFFLC